jgi:hypothetical protein
VADSSIVPGLATGVPPSPVMLTVALAGEPRVAPVLGSDRLTVKVLLPVKGVALLIGTLMLCAVESLAVHDKVPEVAV